MAGLAGGGDPWRISAEERAKHDNQFFQLKPVAGLLTGEQAKNFFLQSGLPMPVLGQIWALADLNNDGKMDKKEFSIAMHLIKVKLQGQELPKFLPATMKADPSPTVGTFGTSPVGAPPMSMVGTMRMPGALMPGPGLQQQGLVAPMGVMPVGMANGGPMMMPGSSATLPPNFGGSVSGAGFGSSTVQRSGTLVAGATARPSQSNTTVPAPLPSGEWAIPQQKKLQYNQMFNMHDRTRKGFLTGVEARQILTQTNLTHTLLAQIWSLSDIDNDGKLTTEEFCLAMHLVDQARLGQVLPVKLPPELIPPSYRRGRSGSAVGVPPAVSPPSGQQPGLPPPPGSTLPPTAGMTQPDAFGDLLGGLGMGSATPVQQQEDNAKVEEGILTNVTFEDKRKENFDKGQAELERRRAALREQQKAEEDARLAHERAEYERREKLRQEQERKKQMEIERQMQKQREIERQREEERRKALEQREAARREMERHRQLEWERQRKEQLIAERQREQNQVEQMQSEVSKLKLELEALNNKKMEVNMRVVQARSGVVEFTEAIDNMRQSRDTKLADIDKFQNEIKVLQERLRILQGEKQAISAQLGGDNDTLDETYKTVLHSHSNKKQNLDRLKDALDKIEQDTAAKLQAIDSVNSQLSQLNNKVNEMQSENQQLQSKLQMKQTEWSQLKRKQDQDDNVQKQLERDKQDRLRRDLEAQRLREESNNQRSTPVATDQVKSLDGIGWGGFDDAFGKTESPKPSNDIWGDAFSKMTMNGQQDATSSSSTPANGMGGADWASAFSGNQSGMDLFGSSVFGSSDTKSSGTPDPATGGTDWATPQPTSHGSDSKPQPAPRGVDFALRPDTGSTGASAPELPGRSIDWPGQQPAAGSADRASVGSTPSEGFAWGDDQSAQNSDTSGWASAFITDIGEMKSATVTSSPSASSDGPPKPGYKKYRAMYQFDARNPDELSLVPGDIVWVGEDQSGAEPGWLGGDMNGREGWFPQAYVELVVSDTPVTEQLPDDGLATQQADQVDDHIYSNPVKRETLAPTGVLTTSEQSSFTAVHASAPSPTPGQAHSAKGQSAPEGLQAQALYPWRAKKENHLTFNKGDIITVKEQQDMWWSGELNGKIGWFPKSYVKLIGTPSANTVTSPEGVATHSPVPDAGQTGTASPSVDKREQTEYYVAMYAYSSSEPDDLNFNQGDIITVSKTEGDWWTGTLGDRTGIFPANYVKKMETQPGQKLAKKPEIASVIAPYQATGAEQLSLQPGQLIQVRKKSPSGWWEGELQARGQKRKIGWFPANYVKLLGTSARNTPDSTRACGSPLKSPTPQPDQDRTATPVPSYPQPTTAPALDQVLASYSYTAQNDDELSFHKGSVINVIAKEDRDWWKGECNGETGMFPSNYVQPLSEVSGMDTPTGTSWSADPSVLSMITPTEQKRQKSIQELIDTEETYMADLSIVLDVFRRPIVEEKVMSEQDAQSVFVNWNELIVCNTKLLKALRVRRKMCGVGQVIHIIGDILCENIPHMTPYIRFCSCQLNAAALIQRKTDYDPRFKEVHKKCVTDPRCKGMPLSSFLLKPMQRITKYPLMIQKLLEYTPPEHPDHQNLQDALTKANELCNQVNEGVREQENSDKLEWIQNHVHCEGLPEKITFNSVTNCLGPRKFMYSGTLYKVKSGKELVAFLFNDFLLLTQPQRPLGAVVSIFSFDTKANTHYRMYRQPLFLNEVLVKPTPEGEEDKTLFLLSHIDRVYSLKAVTPTERDTWVKKIDQASRYYLDTEKKKREKAHLARNELRSCSVGRLLVVILEGVDLKADPADEMKATPVGRALVVILEGVNLTAGTDGKSDPYCEVSMGLQEHKTRVIPNTLNPKWNASMQFTIKDIEQDVLCLTVYDRDLFTPNDFLGRTEVRIKDVQMESREIKGPITKRLLLHEVDSGEVVVKLDLQLFEHT